MAKKKATKAVKKVATQGAARKKATEKKRGIGKRELIDTGRDKRCVRRDGDGQFRESDDVGRFLATDRRKKAKTKAKRKATEVTISVGSALIAPLRQAAKAIACSLVCVL